MILILSSDPVAAALLGAWVETLGYAIGFARPREDADASIRRVRPKVCLLDCEDASVCNPATLGRAAMRRIAVVAFGSSASLERVRILSSEHHFDTLLVPPEAVHLEETLKRALQKAD